MLINYGHSWRRCTECNLILTDNECLDHTCKRPANHYIGPDIKKVFGDWDSKGKHEVAEAQKKGGWNA